MTTKKTYLKLLPVVLFFVTCFAATGMAQVPTLSDCRLARDEFARINNHLIWSRDTTTEDHPEEMKARTQTLEAYFTQIMLARLSDTDEPSIIRNYLRCMQEREETVPPDWGTNTPQVFVYKTPRSLVAVSSMLIMRGGDAILDTRPIVQCFSSSNRRWGLVGGGAEEFEANTFFIHQLKSPNPEESWYLLSGTAIGDTGGRLHLQVVSCSASRYRKVWDREGYIWGKVEVEPDAVVVSYEKRGDPRLPPPVGEQFGPGFILMDNSKDPDPIRFYEALRVTKNGLEP